MLFLLLRKPSNEYNFPKRRSYRPPSSRDFQFAKAKKFALPAVNVIGNNSINTVLETAAELNSPVIIQFSNGGAQFNAGKGLSNDNQQAAIAGAIAGAKHIHELAELYGATVILNTDHCAKNLLPG